MQRNKLLYTVGNLGRLGLDDSGYPYGVEAIGQFESIDLYGPFRSAHEASNFAHELTREGKHHPSGEVQLYRSISVVRIETPHAADTDVIIHQDGEYQYA